MTFSVSVIIPAFNVESFIEKAILSALQQPEVLEVIVVNDGSTDSTEAILNKLQEEYPKVKVFHHLNKINKGRSATRNLGIIKANGNYIAFLDADDFYLPNRFTNDKRIFENNINADGVYNAVGFHFYRAISDSEKPYFKLNTISKKLPPSELFDAVISSKYGYLHLNGITLKASVFNTIGFFNESLKVAEDSDIIYKMALGCTMEPSEINEAVAKRGIHETNVYTKTDLYKIYNMKLYESVIAWSSQSKVSLKKIDSIFKYMWIVRYRENHSLIKDVGYWFQLVFKNPEFIFTSLTIKYFPIVRLRQKLFPFLFK
ncbi:glycosyltransferase family 2 protein [Mariniflexile sp.]|uniref:glycosyltransferase family 2 protein n=1 Tax=Mariniflexile sp. TaxID=1979402 RepID=UPI003569A754